MEKPSTKEIVFEWFYDGEDEGETSVSQVHIDDASPTLLEVEHSLNMYLQKNKGG